jgi:hypothetical protein
MRGVIVPEQREEMNLGGRYPPTASASSAAVAKPNPPFAGSNNDIYKTPVPLNSVDRGQAACRSIHCKIIRIHCSAIQTLLQLNSNNPTVQDIGQARSAVYNRTLMPTAAADSSSDRALCDALASLLLRPETISWSRTKQVCPCSMGAKQGFVPGGMGDFAKPTSGGEGWMRTDLGFA